VDGETIKDAYENLPQQKEYRELLETAASRVVEKVIILVCDNCSLPPMDKEIVIRTIEDTIIRRGKGLIAWLNKWKAVCRSRCFGPLSDVDITNTSTKSTEESFKSFPREEQ